MEVKRNYSLRTLNTFGINAMAAYFSAFSNSEELGNLIDASKNHPRMILGGGSNILFTADYNGYVLKNEINGIEIVKEGEEHVYVKVGAGENWHRFVLYCLDHNLAGVENLSLIPGNTGASPMQNIGAYGVELKDIFHELEAFHIGDKKTVTFTHNDCEFGYRESVFKNRYKGEFVILNMIFRLNKTPIFHTEYGAIAAELEKMNQEPSIHAISRAVINIRSSKLPDPKQIGNAGSFFKNPAVPEKEYENLKKEYAAIPGYPQSNGSVKLAAGWLIEQCGWKGYRKGDAGCHSLQALVLVNYGNATGDEIYALSEEIRKSVLKKFGVNLEREVNVVRET